MPLTNFFESYASWFIQIYWRQQARLGLQDTRREGPASQTSTVCKLCSDGVLCNTDLNLLSPCWSNPTWILHMMEIKMFSKGSSMLSLVVKNDVYTYEITTLIQYCKSPNTPSLTLIPYELWAKVGNNCFIPLKQVIVFLSHQDKKQEQRGLRRSGHGSIYGWPSVTSSTAETRLEVQRGPSIKATLEVLIWISTKWNSIKKVLLNPNKHDHLCSTTQHRLAQWEGVWLSRWTQQWYTIHTCWLLHSLQSEKKAIYVYNG